MSCQLLSLCYRLALAHVGAFVFSLFFRASEAFALQSQEGARQTAVFVKKVLGDTHPCSYGVHTVRTGFPQNVGRCIYNMSVSGNYR